MNAFLRLITEYRNSTVFGLLVVTLIATLGIRRLGFDDSYHEAFRSDDVRYEQLQKLTETFGAGDADCVVVLESSDMLSRSSLDALRKMHGRFGELPEVESTVSLFSMRRPKRVGRLFLPLLPGEDAKDKQLERARQESAVHPLVVDRLLTNDRRTSLVLVRLRSGSDSIDAIEPILANIRRIAKESSAGSDVTARLTGIPAIRVETIRRLQREHVLITLAGAVCATIVSWLMLRRMAAVFVVVTPAVLGVIWTLGALGLAGRSLNAVNIVLPPLVMVIGISDSIHLMFHFREACAKGLSPKDAAWLSIRELAGACSLTALTTSVGFLSLLYSKDRIIGEFGIFGAIGVSLTFLTVLTTLPLLCTTRLGRACLVAEKTTSDRNGGMWTDRIFDFVARHALRIAPVLIVATVAMIGSARSWKADFHFLENLTEESESHQAMRRIESAFGGSPLLQILVEWPHAQRLDSPETNVVLQEIHAALAKSSILGKPTSILTVLDSLPAAEGGLAERFDDLRLVPREKLRSLVAEERRMALVAANVPDAGAAALREPLDVLDRDLAAIEQRHPDYRLAATGFAVASTYRAGAMITDLLEGLSAEVFVILIVISCALRSWQLGLLSLPSNLFPLLATIFTAQALGLKLQYSTVLALNICLGIAVDDTVHFLSRYRRELKLDGDRQAAAKRTFRAVAPVMGATTLLMLTGFGAGLFCSIPTVRDFSICACTALILALVSEVVVMPTALLCVARFVERRRISREVCPLRRSTKTEKLFRIVLLVGLVASISTAVVAWYRSETIGDWCYWLIWPAMLLHQCEENIFTELVLGRRFAFLRWVRTVGYDLPPARALTLNVFVGWTLALCAGTFGSGLCGAGWCFVPLYIAAVEAVNGFWHLSVASLQRRWSPGTLSSIVITIPLACALFHDALARGWLEAPECYAMFFAACVSHHLFLHSLPRVANVARRSLRRSCEVGKR